MKPKMIWANFCVEDAGRTHEFYTRLGFTSQTFGGPGMKLASFLFGNGNFVIHFFERGSQIDAFLPPSEKGSEIIFTLSAETEEQVNDWMNRVKEAGGTLLSEAQRDENNYYGFAFADPDGHKFNVLLMEQGM